MQCGVILGSLGAHGNSQRRGKVVHALGRFRSLGLSFGTNQSGFLKLSDAESMNFHFVPNQVLYQAEPLPDWCTLCFVGGTAETSNETALYAYKNYSIRLYCEFGALQMDLSDSRNL